MHEWVAAKASMCDLLRFGVACCVISISGDSLGVPITDQNLSLGATCSITFAK